MFSKSKLLDSFRFTWDLSYCSPGSYIFKIEANDGNSTSGTDGTMIEIREKMFGILPYPEEYKVPIFSGVAAGLILSGLRPIIRRTSKIVPKKTKVENTEKGIEQDKESDDDLRKGPS